MRLHEHEQRLYKMPGKDVKQKVTSAVAAADPQSPIAHGRKNFDAWGLPSVLSSVNHEVQPRALRPKLRPQPLTSCVSCVVCST